MIGLFLRSSFNRICFAFSEFSFQAARDVSGHSPKTRIFKHMYKRQILAIDFISLCQTKEWLKMGHPCIITADPYIVISSLLYSLAQWGNDNHVSACQVRGTSLVGSSRRQIWS